MTTISTFQLESQRGKDAPDMLHEFLRENRGNDVEISLQSIQTLSGPQIELLLSGYHHWQAAGHQFSLVQVTPELITRLTGFGLPSQLFSKEAE